MLSGDSAMTDRQELAQTSHNPLPLWGLVLVLAEIAERVSRREAQEQHTSTPREKSRVTLDAA